MDTIRIKADRFPVPKCYRKCNICPLHNLCSVEGHPEWWEAHCKAYHEAERELYCERFAITGKVKPVLPRVFEDTKGRVVT